MRTRARTSNTTLAAGIEFRQELNTPTMTLSPIPTAAFTYNSLTESMSDELPLKRRSGGCVHSKTQTSYYDSQATTFLWSSGGINYKSVCTGSCLYQYFIAPNPSVTDMGNLISPSGFDWGNASFQAIKRMRPSISDGLLLPNFLAELAETGRDLAKAVKSRKEHAERRAKARERERARLANAKRLSNDLHPEFRKLGRNLLLSSYWNKTIGMIKKLSRTVANANLAWQFAVAPTVSDAQSLLRLIQQYKDKVNKLIKEAEKRQVRHYTRPVDNVVSLLADGTNTVSAVFNGSTKLTRRRRWQQRPVYHASMLFTYDATALRGLLGKINGVLYALGVTRIASVIWEAIPFSFVVDWFVRVGDLIESVEDQLIDPLPIVIHDFSASLKYEYRTSIELNWADKVITDLAHRSQTYYERRRNSPSCWDALSVHSPNLNQAGLGLSLVIVRMDGITKWRRR
jgi:hypothetical protein